MLEEEVEGDDALIQQACRRLAAHHQVFHEGVRWEAGAPVRRKRSTITPLRFSADDGRSLKAYLKTFLGSTSEHTERYRAAMQRSMLLETRVQESLDALGVHWPRTLAVGLDPPRQIITHVPGAPVGGLARRMLKERSFNDLLNVAGAVGAIARAIGEASPTLHAGAFPDPQQRLRESLEEVQALLASRSAAVQRSVAALDGPRAGTGVYAHADLTTSNVLISGRTIGVIDFGWRPTARHYDLARWLSYLEGDTSLPLPVIRRLQRASVRSYGREAEDDPDFIRLRLGRLLALYRRGHRGRTGRHVRRVTRVLDDFLKTVA